MNVQAWTFVMVASSFALYIGVAIWSRARSTGDLLRRRRTGIAGGQRHGHGGGLDVCSIVHFDGGVSSHSWDVTVPFI